MALFIPVVIGYIFKSKFSWLQRIGAMVVLVLLVTGLIFSYSRAAWVSLAGSAMVYLLILFKVRWRTVLFGIARNVGRH